MMNVLMIGGARFIGLETARQLNLAGHSVTVFHRTCITEFPYRQFQGDCNNTAELRRCFDEVVPDCIIHMVAMEARHITILEQVIGDYRTRVVVVSSADVYKAMEVVNKLSNVPVQAVPLAEEAPLRDARYIYRGSGGVLENYEKIDVENAALDSESIRAVIVRLGMVFGRNDPNGRFTDIIRLMRQSDKIYLPENTSAWRACYSGVRNTARGIVLAAEKGENRAVYNIADSEAFTELEWHNKIARLMNWNGAILVTPSVAASINYDQPFILDSSKIRRELGYAGICSAEEQLTEVANSWQSRKFAGPCFILCETSHILIENL